jgi:hypothetical protein
MNNSNLDNSFNFNAPNNLTRNTNNINSSGNDPNGIFFNECNY